MSKVPDPRADADLRAEVEALAADPDDRAEAARVLRDMEDLRPAQWADDS